jgi:hypothetical protein
MVALHRRRAMSSVIDLAAGERPDRRLGGPHLRRLCALHSWWRPAATATDPPDGGGSAVRRSGGPWRRRVRLTPPRWCQS